MDVSTTLSQTSPGDANAHSNVFPSGEPTSGSPERVSRPTNAESTPDIPGKAAQAAALGSVTSENSRNKIVLEYLQKKGYGRTAEMLEAESRGLSPRIGPSPPQSHPLLDTFGPQAAVALLEYERDSLISFETLLRRFSASPNSGAIKTRLISHISSIDSTRDVRRLPVEELLAGLRSSQERRLLDEETKRIATRRLRPDFIELNGYDVQQLRAVCKSIMSIKANESVNSSSVATNYPLAEWVHRFPDSLVVGQNSGDIVVGQIYDSLEDSEDSVVLFQGEDDQAQGVVSSGATNADNNLFSPKVALEDSDEPAEDIGSQPATPRHARRPGNESPIRSLSRARSADSTTSVVSGRGSKRKFSDAAERIYFCFHDSCSQAYANPRPLETHIERSHKDKWPELPGTCNHEGSIKTFRTWNASLSHLVHHQKEYGMTRKQYDQIHHAASFWLTHSSIRVNREDTSTIPLPSTNSPSHFASGPVAFDGGLAMNFDLNAMQWDPPV
ncbi:hypothetical protein MMC27_002039 [Xylographa pallens]|nr:hypothetical protein [Xylographa pallens]